MGKKIKVRLILDIEVDADAWSEGNHGQSVTPRIVECAANDFVNCGNGGIAGEWRIMDSTSYEMSDSDYTARACRAYKQRAAPRRRTKAEIAADNAALNKFSGMRGFALD